MPDANESKQSPWRRRWFPIGLYSVALLAFALAAVLITLQVRRAAIKPHIVFIIADDVGWNDVSWRDPDMRSPTLEALLKDGVLINESYVHPLDGPSRAAIFTGLYPFHMGLQHEDMRPDTPAFVPYGIQLLPQYLKTLGYDTHYVGKWHLGFCNMRYTPTARGFDSFYGSYTDGLDHYTHKDSKGHYDFRHNENLAPPKLTNGRYSTELLSEWAAELITSYNDVNVPLFLVLAYHAIHSPMQAPDRFNVMCGHIRDSARRTVCAMLAAMDEGIHNVTEALRSKGMLDNTVIVFTSDNGGNTAHGSSNSPLQGTHGQLYEGGTRVPTFLYGGSFLSKPGSTYQGMFHQVDWLPTIVSMAKGDPVLGTNDTDGIDHWDHIRGGYSSPRTEIVYHVDDTFENHIHTGAVREGQYKLIHGPAGNFTTMDPSAFHSHLFDLDSDPKEEVNIANDQSDVDKRLLSRISKLRGTLVPAMGVQRDPKSDPANFGGAWSYGWC